MSQLTDKLKTYQIKVTAGLDKSSSRQKINEDLKSLKTTGPKVVGQLDKKATKKQVNDAVKQLQTAQIKLKGVLDETALKQQISKVKADADVNVTGSEKIKELQENMDKAGDSANAMAAKLYLARTALQALQKAAHEAIETVTELDKAATTLAIVTGGKSGEAYDLIAQYNELAKQLGATTVQVSDAATSWLRQGKTTAETAELIEQSMILSKVAMVDSATATKNLTSAMRGYGKMYRRRGQYEGLGDPDNIKIQGGAAKDGKLVVINTTNPNPDGCFDGAKVTTGKDLPALVEFGQGHKFYSYDFHGKGGYMKPRPFTRKTLERLKQSKAHIAALKAGLKRQEVKTQ